MIHKRHCSLLFQTFFDISFLLTKHPDRNTLPSALPNLLPASGGASILASHRANNKSCRQRSHYHVAPKILIVLLIINRFECIFSFLFAVFLFFGRHTHAFIIISSRLLFSSSSPYSSSPVVLGEFQDGWWIEDALAQTNFSFIRRAVGQDYCVATKRPNHGMNLTTNVVAAMLGIVD
jgi:hypothetical protein